MFRTGSWKDIATNQSWKGPMCAACQGAHGGSAGGASGQEVTTLVDGWTQKKQRPLDTSRGDYTSGSLDSEETTIGHLKR